MEQTNVNIGVLYLKYRPKTFEDVKGNQLVKDTLENMLKDLNTCPHVFLLHGPTGTGKTTIARIIATRLGAKGNDFREINTADFRGIDTARDVIKSSQFMPMESSCRVWLIDECHKLTKDAQNSLLKILEDTPKHVYFILCTTEPQDLISTIKGRCSQFQVKPLNEIQMKALLRQVVREENETLEREIYDQIVQDSLGYPRNALQILEQVLRVAPEKRLEIAQQAAEEQSQTIELCRALVGGLPWKEISRILNNLRDQEPESIRRNVLGYCQAILLKEDKERCGLILQEFMDPFYNSGYPQLVYACYSIVKN